MFSCLRTCILKDKKISPDDEYNKTSKVYELQNLDVNKLISVKMNQLQELTIGIKIMNPNCIDFNRTLDSILELLINYNQVRNCSLLCVIYEYRIELQKYKDDLQYSWIINDVIKIENLIKEIVHLLSDKK